jgi:hypothetical protein
MLFLHLNSFTLRKRYLLQIRSNGKTCGTSLAEPCSEEEVEMSESQIRKALMPSNRKCSYFLSYHSYTGQCSLLYMCIYHITLILEHIPPHSRQTLLDIHKYILQAAGLQMPSATHAMITGKHAQTMETFYTCNNDTSNYSGS